MQRAQILPLPAFNFPCTSLLSFCVVTGLSPPQRCQQAKLQMAWTKAKDNQWLLVAGRCLHRVSRGTNPVSCLRCCGTALLAHLPPACPAARLTQPGGAGEMGKL